MGVSNPQKPNKSYNASNAVLYLDAPQGSGAQTAYTLRRSIKISVPVSNQSTLRLKFELNSSSVGNIVYGKLQKNGVDIGTVHTNATTTYTEKSQDLKEDWEMGDVVTLWCYTTNGGAERYYFKNFGVYGIDSLVVKV